jgi:hypothetical protein
MHPGFLWPFEYRRSGDLIPTPSHPATGSMHGRRLLDEASDGNPPQA